MNNDSRKSGSGLVVLAVLLLAFFLLAMMGFGGLVAHRMLRVQYVLPEDVLVDEVEWPAAVPTVAPEEPAEKTPEAPNDESGTRS